jgi:hypothetical protein
MMPVLPVFLFLLAILAGSLPAFSDMCCYYATLDPYFGGSGLGSGSGSACQSVYDLIDTFKGVKEGLFKVFIGSSFAFGLLGGAYAVLRVVF